MSDGHDAGRRSATLVGLIAIAMWASLAALIVLTGAVPPFLLNALAFTVAALIGFGWIAATGGWRASVPRDWRVWLLGVGGLCGYHVLVFAALRLAPPVEASLINYLWPLLIVLFSALMPGETLRRHHVAGAVLGLAGAVLIVWRPGTAFDAAALPGYAAALAAALAWSSYSVLSRRFAHVPTQAVAWFCAATAGVSLLGHAAFETTVLPASPAQWLAVFLLGLGPVGGAFYVWDWGCKRGDIQVLGAAAYAAPVLSTVLLVALGVAEATWVVAAACALVTLGAMLATKDMLRRA